MSIFVRSIEKLGNLNKMFALIVQTRLVLHSIGGRPILTSYEHHKGEPVTVAEAKEILGKTDGGGDLSEVCLIYKGQETLMIDRNIGSAGIFRPDSQMITNIPMPDANVIIDTWLNELTQDT